MPSDPGLGGSASHFTDRRQSSRRVEFLVEYQSQSVDGVVDFFVWLPHSYRKTHEFRVLRPQRLMHKWSTLDSAADNESVSFEPRRKFAAGELGRPLKPA